MAPSPACPACFIRPQVARSKLYSTNQPWAPRYEIPPGSRLHGWSRGSLGKPKMAELAWPRGSHLLGLGGGPWWPGLSQAVTGCQAGLWGCKFASPWFSTAPRLSPGGWTQSKMRRFLRPGHDPARERLKRDLFQFNKVRGTWDTSYLR